ncbi:MAG: dockerin type I repeat-containing protein, partial [Muribaculaceae bacterium]|nr:dockerin type I repeat-containing protein [Muribaculaceae bacterium]
YLLADDDTAAKYYADLFPEPTPDFKTGDVNGDDTVDVTDLNILINIVLGNDNASNYGGRADVTGDGTVDVSDVNALLNIVLGN